MAEKKIIVVFGATGAQGGGLARAICKDINGEFACRAITRDKDSDKAKELANLGAEVVNADIDDPGSLLKAMEGAYGAYCVTFFWSHFSPEREMEEARNMAEAAKACGLKHLIWSTFEDTRKYIPLEDDRMPTLMGNYKVPHFDAKGEANHFFTDNGVPTTFLLTCFYWDNMIYFGMGPKKGADGNLVLTFPMGEKRLSGISSDDIGKCAYGIFKKGQELIGKTVGIAGEHLTGAEMADALTKVLAKKVTYQAISPDDYRSLGFPGAEDLGNMFQFYQEFEREFTAARSVEFSKELNPSLKTFEMFLGEYGERIPVE